MKKIFFFIVTSLCFTGLSAQSILFSEDFESGSRPIGWSEEFVESLWLWGFKDGTGDADHPPTSAYEGNYNAVFYRSDNKSNITKLITPEINLQFAIKPELHFFYAQLEDDLPGVGFDNTKLSIYYRSVEEDNEWRKLKDYNSPTDDWVEAVILIPDSVRYSSVQLAFEGRIDGILGHGTCIDDIKLYETGIEPKFVSSITSVQASTDIIPTGSYNNPILRLKFAVGGNDGILALESMAVNALNDASDIVATNGVKLFTTIEDYFVDTIQIGSASSIINNQAVFNNIDYNLPIGNSYVWVTYDIPADSNHEFKNKVVDASISTNEILINGTQFPGQNLDPIGDRILRESLFYDDFEGVNNWILNGEFEINRPKGLGGPYGQPDPTFAISGINVLGTDLSGTNTQEGNYEKNLSSKEEIAFLDSTFYGRYYKDLTIQFYQWLNVYNSDTVSIDMSLDNGASWSSIWKNKGRIANNKYFFKQLNLSSSADRQNNIIYRITLGPTGNLYPYSGWNIDNFALTGTFIDYDTKVLSLLSPSGGCGHVGPEPVTAVIKNTGFLATKDTVSIGYSIDGGSSWVMDTIYESIPKNGIDTIIFSQLIDISNPGYYNLSVKTFLPGDEDSRNDQFDTTLYSSPTYNLPYFEDFEDGDGFWQSFGVHESFEIGIPSDSIINKAYSGQYCYATNLSGNYKNNDSSWIESPCIDFTNIDKPVFECRLWCDAEANNDGLALYYSIDEGYTWQLVPTETTHSFNWDWYNNANISSLGTEGWDSIDNGWFLTRQLLPETISGYNSVKLKLLFESNDTITDAGFAVDDIRIYNAPTDAGITEIVYPTDTCYLSETQNITVAVKNYGIRPIKTTDPIMVNLDNNDEIVFKDTIYLSSELGENDTAHISYKNTLNMFDKKDYKLTAYTIIPVDTSYYQPNMHNDTIVDTISVYGEPQYSLGPDIGTLNPDAELLDAGAGYYNYLWTNLHDNSTTASQIYDVPSFSAAGVTEMSFAIEFENDSACTVKDTIKVIESISNLGVIFASITDSSSCINQQAGHDLYVKIKNFSIDTTYENLGIINVGYKYNGSEIHSEEINITEEFAFEDTIEYTFVTPPVLPDSGSFNLEVFTITYADLDYSNDTTRIPLSIYAIPNIDLGNDTIFTQQADTILLEPGLGFASYSWSDGSSDATLLIPNNFTNKYKVTVTDTNSCGSASDSIFIVADSWKLDTIINPVTQCDTANNANLSVLLINNSPNTYPQNYEIKSEIIFNDTLTETILLPETLNPYDSIDYTFANKFNITEAKEYKIKVSINPDYDINRTDNKSFETINIWGVFPVDIGPDSIVTRRADTIILQAGDIYDTYQWQDLSSENYFSIQTKESATYSVIVTDEHGCSNSSDELEIISYDIGITEILTPESECKLTGTNIIKFSLQNFGTDVVPAGTEISYFYNINNGEWIEKKHTLNSNLEGESSVNILLYEDIQFDSTETYTMKLYSKWDKDYFYDNDTAETVIYQYNSPSVNLGPDIITSEPNTITLDGGADHTTYTWQDYSKERYFNVVDSATYNYSIMVTNPYGCKAHDTITIFTYDIGIASINNLNNCITTGNIVTANIAVISYDTLLVNDNISARYIIGSDTVTELVTLTDSLYPGKPYPYTFATPFNVADTGNYSIKCWVAMANEVDSSNNSTDTTFRIGAYPVELGEDIVTYNSSEVLDAGSGFSTYEWSETSTSQSITVTDDGLYKVTTTDVNGCKASDSVNVLFMVPGYNISEILGLVDACEHSTSEMLSFVFQNTGNDTIKTNSNISIDLKINSLDAVNEDYTFGHDFSPGAIDTISITNTANLSDTGKHVITVTATVNSSSSSNDTTINTWAAPDVNLGNDIESTADVVTLDANADYTSYNWSTNEQTRAIEVTADGNYSITVTNIYGCANSDTINVFFVPASLYVSEFSNPLKGCEALVNETVKMVVTNNGAKLIPAETVLVLGYQIADQERVNETNRLATEFPTGSNYTYEFTTPLNYNSSGNQTLKLYINMDDEDMDTATYMIPVYEKPEIFNGQDSIEVSSYPYELDSEVSADSYLWNTDATTETINVNSDGEYWVQITSPEGCQFSESIIIYKLTGIGTYDAWSKHIKVYPNPGEHEIWVELPSDIVDVTLQIIDVNGKVILSNEHVKSNLRLNITEFKQGVYLLRIFNNEKYGIYQIIKK